MTIIFQTAKIRPEAGDLDVEENVVQSFSWGTVPNVTFIYGQADSYDLSQHLVNPNNTDVVYSVVGTLPDDVELDTETGILSYYGVGAAAVENIQVLAAESQPGNEDWDSRSTGPGVVWAHNFANPNEVYNFLKLPGDAPGADDVTYGVHDPIFHARHITSDFVSGGGCMEITNLGARLAADIDDTQTVITLDDASLFPDPAGDPAKYYWLAIHADETNPQYIPAGSTPGSKGWKECVVVVSKLGNALTVLRGQPPERETATIGGTGAKAFLAGTPIGNDSDGGWARPFSALVAADNGLATDDPAASNSLPKRTHVARENLFQNGYYAHQWYWAQPEFQNWAGNGNVFDGDEFYLQFRQKISSNRWDADMRGGKLWFIHMMGTGGAQQIVGKGPGEDTDDRVFEVFGNFGQEPFERNPPSGFADLIYPVDTAPGGTYYPLCVVGDKEPLRCYSLPLNEWFTTQVRVKCGYSRDDTCPSPPAGNDDYYDMTVTTVSFTPTNDGTTLTFETTAPNDFLYWPTSRYTANYFKDWKSQWPRDTAAGRWPPAAEQWTNYDMLCTSSTHIVDAVNGNRMRWSFQQRGTRTFPGAGVVPSAGHVLQVQMVDQEATTIYTPATANMEMDVWIRTNDGTVVHLYGLRDYAIVMGDGGENVFNQHVPGWNCFQPTGYANVVDNLAPPPEPTWYRFDEIIFSKNFVPWPT